MKNYITLLVFLLAYITNTLAQWQPDVRLTNNSAASNTSDNNAWCVASSGNEVHVVWYDERNAGFVDIYYKRSSDGGLNWGTDTRLSNSLNGSYHPSVSVYGSVVHVVWNDYRNGNNEIYYKRSTDGGNNWGTDIRLTNNSYDSFQPSVSVSGSTVHVVWRDYRYDQFGDIFYKRSTDGGISWGPDISLTISNNTYSAFPSISVSGSVVHVVWHDSRDGNSEIYYKRSTDGGISWGSDTRLTNNTANSTFPSVSVSGSNVLVVWEDERLVNSNRIYFKRSTDGGINWGSDMRLTNNNTYEERPSVSMSGSVVHTVWMDQRNGPLEVYYKCSTDGGLNWVTDVRLTNASNDLNFPSVSASGSIVHVVWRDKRDGNFEIYYKRDPTGNVVGIKNINSGIPKEFSLSQNYPNPFNPVTNIEFAVPVYGYVNIKVYDINGKEVSILVNEKLQAGSYKADWNAVNFPSGVYFYTIRAESFTETKKMVFVK